METRGLCRVFASFFTLFFEARSLAEPGAHLFSKTSWPLTPGILVFPLSEYWDIPTHTPVPSFLDGYWDLNLGPVLCGKHFTN